MEAAEIVPAKRYAFRRRQGDPLECIKIIEKVRSGRWKVEFLDDPNPGITRTHERSSAAGVSGRRCYATSIAWNSLRRRCPTTGRASVPTPPQ